MAPKKIVPKGTDDIIELTDIVEQGKLPPEDTGAGLTDASFEDELDSMLADVPELSAAKKEVAASPGFGVSGDQPPPVAASSSASVDSDEFADLDSLLEGLDDDLAAAAPPAPKAAPAAPAGDVLLDVDDLLAEAGAADKTDFITAVASDDAADNEQTDVDVDDFLAEFADMEAPLAEVAAPASIDGATVDADELLAELQGAIEPEVEDDDILAELKSVMGDGEAETAAAPEAAVPEAAAPEADPFEAAMAATAPASKPVAPVADPFESAIAAAAATPDPFAAAIAAASPEVDPFEAAAVAAAAAPEPDPFEAAMAANAPVDEDLDAMVADVGQEEAAAPEAVAPEVAAPESPAEEDALAAEDLQQLDALLDDILQPGAAAAAEVDEDLPGEEEAVPAEAEPAPQAAAFSEEIFEPAEPAVAAAFLDMAALTAELLAEDGPLLATVRDLVQQDMEARLAVLEERLARNLDQAAAQAAARIIREEIAVLAQDLVG